MFGFWPIYKRECKTFFQSPSTYVVMALYFLIVGWVFFGAMRDFSMLSERAGQMSMFGQQQQAPNVTQFVIMGMFGLVWFIFMFTIPLLAMRLVAEEKSRGTFELLVTCPIGDWAILLGKYFALLSVGVAAVLLSGVYPLIVWYIGKANNVAPEWPVVISCWTGLFLIFATFAAFGVMASSFTENQVIAGMVTLIGIIMWLMVGMIRNPNERLQAIVLELDLGRHIENFNKGVLTLKDFVFFILASFFFLFVASKTLDARRWRV